MCSSETECSADVYKGPSAAAHAGENTGLTVSVASQTKRALYRRGRATSGPSKLSPQCLLSLFFLFFLIPLEPCEGGAGILWCGPLQQIS